MLSVAQLSNISREAEWFFFCFFFALVCFILSVTGALYCLVLSKCPCMFSPVVPNHCTLVRTTTRNALQHSTCKKGSCALTLCFAAISWPCSLVTFLRWTRSTLFATNTIGKASLHTRQEQVMNLTAAGRERLLNRLHTFCGRCQLLRTNIRTLK